MRYVLLGAGVLILAAIIALGIWSGTRGQPGRTVAIQGAEHISLDQQHTGYNTRPATSGPHWSGPGAPLPWGIYKEPQEDEALVHNLEHGGIGMHYNCRDCPELVERLEQLYNEYSSRNRLPLFPNSSKIIVSPYYDAPSRISLTAWGRIDQFDDFDEGRITRFLDAYRSKVAPESNVP